MGETHAASLFGKQEASSGARSFALSNCTGMLRLC
jgi:hypothetical protein